MTQNASLALLKTPDGIRSLRKFIAETASELLGVVEEIEHWVHEGTIRNTSDLLRYLPSQYNRNAVEKILKNFFKKCA